MAISISFFLVYSKKKILSERLSDHSVSIRAQVRYTRSHLNWSAARRFGHSIERIQFTTPVKAQPRWWANGKVKHNHPNAPAINATLDAIAARAVALHSEYIATGAFPSVDDYIAAMLGAQEAAVGPASTLFGYYEAYISYLTDRSVNITTRRRHAAILKILHDFQNKTGYSLEFETINKTFAAKFTAWCVRNLPRQRAAQDIERATVPRYLKDLRNFLNHALSEGWTAATAWRQIKHGLKQTSFPVTVTIAEIGRLWALRADDLEGGKARRNSALITRDWFVLATQTAMRWSDWQSRRFRFIPVSEGYNLQFVQEKTDDPLEIPLSTLAIQILQKYDFDMPPVFSPATTIAHLSTLARAAGIPKHLTTHTARRTFCTLQEAAGVPRGVIMRITGHRTEKDYLRYTGITYRVNADLMRRANPDMFKSAG